MNNPDDQEDSKNDEKECEGDGCNVIDDEKKKSMEKTPKDKKSSKGKK